MKNILVSGSLAYDFIMSFDGTYEDTILPEKIDQLSVSYLANSRERYFGGCSGNICYSLKLLDVNPFIFAVGGSDIQEYKDWLDTNDIGTKYLEESETELTAAAYILNDRDHNQFSIFSPGAMMDLEKAMSFDVLEDKIDLALIGPDVPDRMVKVAEECVRKGIPYIFDPGQAMSALDKLQLHKILENSIGVIMNEYETGLLNKRMEVEIEEILELVPFIIETLGKKGVKIYRGESNNTIETAPIEDVVGVTGCGDSFRAGFLYGYVNGKDLETCCRYGNFTAAKALMFTGTQNHQFSKEDLIKL